MELLHEKETIQKCLKDPQSKRETGMVSRKFASVMRKQKQMLLLICFFINPFFQKT